MASIYATSESLHAYLFECEGDAGLFAVSLEPLGSNIPLAPCFDGWRMREAFELGVHEAMPVAIDPEPVLQGIRARGYYVWRQGTKR
jgi:hypothetical protein